MHDCFYVSFITFCHLILTVKSESRTKKLCNIGKGVSVFRTGPDRQVRLETDLVKSILEQFPVEPDQVVGPRFYFFVYTFL